MVPRSLRPEECSFMRRTFRGGVHPPYHKEPAKDKSIQSVPLPGVLVVPLIQHLGAPCKP
ncbi:MAG: hypothetical protein ACOC8N_09870, partial [Spirochaetota bacterium]